MRSLKFRVWNKRAKVYDEYFELSPKWTQNGDQIIDNKAFIIEQYTGLKDKNGKEIYEGDIVKVEDDEYTPDTNKFLGYNATVKTSTSKGGAFIVKNWWGEQILNWDVPLRRVEVIGNIHENPELLEEEE